VRSPAPGPGRKPGSRVPGPGHVPAAAEPGDPPAGTPAGRDAARPQRAQGHPHRDRPGVRGRVPHARRGRPARPGGRHRRGGWPDRHPAHRRGDLGPQRAPAERPGRVPARPPPRRPAHHRGGHALGPASPAPARDRHRRHPARHAGPGPVHPALAPRRVRDRAPARPPPRGRRPGPRRPGPLRRRAVGVAAPRGLAGLPRPAHGHLPPGRIQPRHPPPRQLHLHSAGHDRRRPRRHPRPERDGAPGPAARPVPRPHWPGRPRRALPRVPRRSTRAADGTFPAPRHRVTGLRAVLRHGRRASGHNPDGGRCRAVAGGARPDCPRRTGGTPWHRA